MDLLLAKELSKKLQISVDRVVQEEYELFLLKEIFDSGLGNRLVFKGGTALRLAYGSPRFSEDLDFSILKSISQKEFCDLMRKISQTFVTLKLIDCRKKHYTLFAVFKATEEFLAQSFSIKIEVSRRKKIKKYELKLLTSPVSNLQVLAKVMTLDNILTDKLNAAKERGKSRDLFDLWYIGELKKVPVEIPKVIPLSQLRAELHKYLPKNYWEVVEGLAQ